MNIASIAEMIQFLSHNVPNFRYKSKSEYSSKSPFRQEGQWVGDDGCLWFFDAPTIRIWDRKLGINGQHIVTELKTIWDTLPLPSSTVDWVEVESQLEHFTLLLERSKVVRTAPWSSVQQYHSTVERDYWYDFNLSDAVINEFYLGYGFLPYYKYPRHIIPIPIADYPGKYTFSTRRAVDEDPNPHFRPSKAPTTYWYSDFATKDKTKLYVAEGGTSFLASIEMGFSPCLTTNHGAGKWFDEWSKTLLHTHPEITDVIFLGDNDAVGQEHVRVVMKSILRSQRGIDREFKFYNLLWDADTPESYDPADVLRYMGLDYGRDWIEKRLIYSPIDELEDNPRRHKYVSFVQTVPEIETIPLEIARDEHDIRGIRGGLKYFLNNEPEGKVYISAFPPGTGKNFALIGELQERARQHLNFVNRKEVEHDREIDRLRDELQLEPDTARQQELVKRIAKLSKPINKRMAVVASPYRDSFSDMETSHPNMKKDLWFYFDSRNKTNCENYEKATRVAAKGYNVSLHVCQTCPFKQACQQSGYLSQFDKMKEFPLVSIRHQHLLIDDICDAKEVYIDEFPGDAILNSQSLDLRADDIRLPEGWEEWIEHLRIEPIRLFVSLLQSFVARGYYEKNRRAVLSGRDLFDMLEIYTRQTTKLSWIDILDQIHPDTLRTASLTMIDDGVEILDESWRRQWQHMEFSDVESESLPRRCVDLVYQILKYESQLYRQDPYQVPDWNGRIFLLGNHLIVRPMEKMHIPDKVPVVVTDAYPILPVYEQLFANRQVVSYSPHIVNPETKTTVLHGCSFNISDMKKNIRSYDKEIVNLKKEGFPNVYLEYSWKCILKLLETHNSLIVITHKAPTDYLQLYWNQNKIEGKQVYFNNYRAVRGLNTYAGLEAILLIGTPRKPETAVEVELQSLFYEDPIPLVFSQNTRYTIPYHNREDGYEIESYSDPRVYDMVVQELTSEVKQAAARIRPHTSQSPKHVYIMASIPTLEWVTDAMYYRDFIEGNKNDKAEDWAREWLTKGFKDFGKWAGQNRFISALRTSGFPMGSEAARILYKSLIQELGEKYG